MNDLDRLLAHVRRASFIEAYDTPNAHFVTHAYEDPSDMARWYEISYRAIHTVQRALSWRDLPEGVPAALPVFMGTLLDRRLADGRWRRQQEPSWEGREIEAVTFAFPTADLQQLAYDALQAAKDSRAIGQDAHRDPPSLYSLPPRAIMTPRNVIALNAFGLGPRVMGGGRTIFPESEEDLHAFGMPFPTEQLMAVVQRTEEAARPVKRPHAR